MTLLPEFHEIRFPTDIGLGASGGPRRATEIVTLGSGHEKRNQRWSGSRRRFDVGYGVKTLDQLYALLEFFEARRGPLHAFRFRDPLDWKSSAPGQEPSSIDQHIGVGDGVEAQFEFRKQYGSGASAWWRVIDKPVPESIQIAVDGTAKSLGDDFAFNAENASVEFTVGAIPAAGAVVTAGFEFDVPVRFEQEELRYNLEAFTAGQFPTVSLQEVFL